MILTVDGQSYEITNWDEFQEKFLKAIGFQLQSEIRKQVDKMNLIGTTKQLRIGTDFVVQGNELTMTSSAPHAVYIEYGTAGTRKGVTDPFGESSRGPNTSRKMPPVNALKDWAKMKGIDNVWALAKHIQKFGTPPFAPFRRVMYNKNKMAQIISKAARNVSL